MAFKILLSQKNLEGLTPPPPPKEKPYLQVRRALLTLNIYSLKTIGRPCSGRIVPGVAIIKWVTLLHFVLSIDLMSQVIIARLI